MRVLRLPNEFAELLQLETKPSFAEYARPVRLGDQIILTIDVNDFTEDDLLVALARNAIVIIGIRKPASFCLNVDIPPDALAEEMAVTIKDGVLELRMPVKEARQQPERVNGLPPEGH